MRLLLACAALALAGCGDSVSGDGTAAAEAQSGEVTLTQFQQLVDEQYIAPFVAGDVDRWLEVFDEEAVGMHNRVPAMEGAQELREFGEFVAANLRVEDMAVSLTGIRQQGDLAYSWGTYQSRLIMRDSGEPMPGHAGTGKVLFVWKRQPNGEWKITVDMGNDLPPESAPAQSAPAQSAPAQ